MPRPEAVGFLPLALLLPDGVHHIQQVKRGVRDRHGPEYAAFPLLERLERHSLAGEVYPLRRQGEGFGNAATRVMQERAEGAHLARELLRGLQKGGAFGGGQIEPLAVAVMQDGQGRFQGNFPVCNRTHKGSVAKLAATGKQKPAISRKTRGGQGERATLLPIVLQRVVEDRSYRSNKEFPALALTLSSSLLPLIICFPLIRFT